MKDIVFLWRQNPETREWMGAFEQWPELTLFLIKPLPRGKWRLLGAFVPDDIERSGASVGTLRKLQSDADKYASAFLSRVIGGMLGGLKSPLSVVVDYEEKIVRPGEFAKARVHFLCWGSPETSAT